MTNMSTPKLNGKISAHVEGKGDCSHGGQRRPLKERLGAVMQTVRGRAWSPQAGGAAHARALGCV